MSKTDQLYQLVWMSRPLMQATEAAVEKGLEGSGLTVRMRAVLEMLHLHGDLTVPDIAQKLEIQRQYVQVMVNETLAAGFTEQRPNPRHKRSTLLTLTDKGRDLIEGVVESEQTVIDTVGAEFDAADVQTALNVVLALTDRLKTHVEGAQ